MRKRILIPALLAIASPHLGAAPDTVDSSFAQTAGQIYLPGDYGGVASVLVQPDGKVLFGSNEMAANVGGTPLQLSLVRFNPDGSVDNTFHADNEANGSDAGIYYDGQGWPEVHALGLLSDGRIVAAGVMQGVRTGTVAAPGTFLRSNSIVRFNGDGGIDTTFQTAGTMPWPTGGLNYIEDITIQPDDKTIAVGGFGGFRNSSSVPTVVRYGIARLNVDGSVDTGFQVNPLEFGVPAGVSNLRGWFRQAALDSSGRILVVGGFEWGSSYPVGGTVLVLARLHPDGSLDSSFSPSFPSTITNLTGVVVEPDGKITVTGTGSNGNAGWMARYLPDGSPDPAFNLDPAVTGSFGARPLQHDAQGRYLLNTRSPGSTMLNRLIRILPGGALDPSFNAGASYVNGPAGAGSGYFGTFTTSSSGKIYSGSFFDRVNGVDTVKVVSFEGDHNATSTGTIQFAAQSFSGTEQSGLVRVAVSRTGGILGAASATLSLGHGTTSAADISLPAGTVTFAAGEGGTKFILLPVTADNVAESAETATLSITGVTGAAAGTRQTAALTVIDSDSPPVITLQPGDLFVPPGNAFSLNVGVSSGSTPVTYQWFRNGSPVSGAIALRYSVSSADPAAHNGTYTVAVTNPEGTTTSGPAVVTVKDPAILRFTASSASVVENGGTLVLTLQRGGSSVGAVSTGVQSVNGTATSPADFTLQTTTVSWADGDTADKTVTINLVNDSAIEPAENFRISLTSPSLDATFGVPSHVDVTLLDDDSGPAITAPLVSRRVVTGWGASLTVGVQSQTPVTYQWFKDGVLLPGETTATLSFSPVTLADFGYYSVEATNTAGTVTSGPVELGARPDPLAAIPLDLTISSNQFSGVTARPGGGYLFFGAFTSLPTSTGTVTALRVARTGPDGKVDTTFLPPVGSTVSHGLELADGSVIIGGSFTSVGVVSVPGGFTRLLPDGSVDATFLENLPPGIGTIRDLELGPDGKIYLTHANGVDRLETDGTADLAFRANVLSGFQSGGTYNNLEFIPGGGYYLAGNLNLLNGPSGQTLRRLVKLNPNGTNDTTWKYTTAGGLTTFGVQSDGKVIVPTSSLTRLNLDGSTDTSFTTIPSVYNQVFGVAADDSIYSATGSGASSKIRHHWANGSADTLFNNGTDPALNNSLSFIRPLSDGAIAIHGSFTQFNGQAAASRPFLITGELRAIRITSQPLASTVDPGEDTTFTVVATSVNPLSYQWKRNGNDIPGANRPSLTLDDVTTADSGTYTVVVTSSAGQIVSAPAMLTVRDAPAVLSGPSDTEMLVGQALSLTVDWVGLTPATFEWLRNGTVVPGQGTNTLSIASPTQADSGVYVLRITNALGQVTSAPVVVNVIQDPAGIASGFIPPNSGSSPQLTHILPGAGGAHIYHGTFSTITHPSGVYRKLERIASTGNIATPFDATVNTNLQKIYRHPASGDIILTGSNFVLNGTGSRRIARISSGGTENTTYGTNAQAVIGNMTPSSIAFTADGKTIVGGTTIYRLNADGTQDTAFTATTSPAGAPVQMIVMEDGRILGLTNSSLFAILAGGGQDLSFGTLAPAGTTSLEDMGISPEGEILLACPGFGASQLIRRISQSGVELGTIPFPAATYGTITDFNLLKDGSMLLGHTSGKRLTRLLPDGSLDPMFDIGTGFNGTIQVTAEDQDGSVWVGGSFTSYKGTNASGLVRLTGKPADVRLLAQPSNLTVDAGATASFTVEADAGSSGMTYLWRKNGFLVTDGGDVSGATTATLSISNSESVDEGAYSVIVTNTTTGRPIASRPATLTVLREPEILALTGNQNLEVGQPLTLTVQAQGAGTLGYQWLRNGQMIAGANAPTYQVTVSSGSDTGVYSVDVTNLHGTTPSADITVNVTLPAGGVRFGTGNIVFASGVNAILPLPDGRTLVGGLFTSVIANAASHQIDELALLDEAGNLVTTFDLNPSGAVNTLALMPDGGVLVGGNFNQIGGVNRTRVARLTPALTVDSGWNVGTGANNQVQCITPAGYGYYIAGQFTSFNGDTTRSYVCRIQPDGSLDPTFTPPVLGSVFSVRKDGEGVVVGGTFTINNPVSGINQTGIARLDFQGKLDTSFRSSMTSGTTVYDVLPLPDGKWLAGGSSGRMARFNADGTADSSWLTTANVEVRSLALQQDGRILVGGNFTTIAGQPVNRLARLNPNGTLDGTFAQGTGADGALGVVAVDALGGIHIGGAFNNYRGEQRGRYAFLNGSPLSIGIAAQPAGLILQPEQDAVFSVTVRATDTVTYQWRKNGTPLVDGGKVSGAATSTLTIAGATDADEAGYDVLVTHNGDTTTLTSSTAELLVLGGPEILSAPVPVTTEVGMGATFRVNARGAGSLAYQWFRGNTPLVDGNGTSGATSDTLVLSNLAVSDSGQIRVRVTNSVDQVDSVPVALLVQFLPMGRDYSAALPVSVNGTINDLLLFDDGGYMLAGTFTSVGHSTGTATVRYLAKFSASGVPNAAVPQVNGSGFVEVIARAADGKVYIGGGFTSLNTGAGGNVTRNRIARLNSDLTLDTTFTPVGTGPNGTVKAILPLADGKVLIAGEFNSVNSVAGTAYIARLDSTGAVDTGFVSLANTQVRDIADAGNGTYWVAHPNNYSGQQSLVRVDGTGAKVATYSYPGSMTASKIVPQPDGSALSLGSNYPFIQKVQQNGALVPAWPNTGGYTPNNSVTAALTYSDGRSIIGGNFVSYSNTVRNNLAVIEPDGSLVPDFDPGSGLNGAVNRIRLDSAGRIWIAGAFTTYRGENVPRLVVLNGYSGSTADAYSEFVSELPEGQRGETSDPDGDGLPNLVEFVLGSAPGSFSPALVTTESSSTGASLSASLDPTKSYRVVSVELPKDTKGVDLTLAATTDLTFTDAATATEFGTRTDNGTTEIRHYYLTPAVGDTGKLFWRLEASR